jgi:hypothetical protein
VLWDFVKAVEVFLNDDVLILEKGNLYEVISN